MSSARSTGARLRVLVLGAGLAFSAAGAWQLQRAARAEERARHTNRLANETSPYLLQHAHNPVDWYPWGPEAFARAKREGKPVFLSVGYSSCHWCHVMERECFEDEGIAKLLNDHFVAIKVDREERPDIDEIYMTAVQMLTGAGGWPMSVFLTPEGKPFFGGTYFPRDRFAELLRKVHEAWTAPETRKQIDESAGKLAEAVGESAARAPRAGSISPALSASGVRSYLGEMDPRNGGFGGAPKFPPAARLALMLAHLRRRPDPKLRSAVTLTLDHMARGGMYDQVGGGFHRYSTDDRWLVPHFEKMLYDQALLAWSYLEGFRTTREPYYRRIATETLDFTLRELRDTKGGFWSTLDADSPAPDGRKAEGWFYLWTPREVEAVLGRPDAQIFDRAYGITAPGNFEGRNIPNLLAKSIPDLARERHVPAGVLWKRLDGMRARLRAARDRRPPPGLDDKVLANWNGLMLRALALAYDLTSEERYRAAAEETAAFLTGTMLKDGRLSHSYRAGKTGANAFLEDYAFTTVGLLELHRATGDERWLRSARALAKTMAADFWDEKGGAFFATPAGHEKLLVRLSGAEDSATPSGASMAALALVRLARLTNDAALRAKARRVLETYATPMKRYPGAMAGMLLAAEAYFQPDDAAPAADRDNPVTVSAEGPSHPVRAGETVGIRVRFQIRAGWHINANRLSRQSLVATSVRPVGEAFRLEAAEYPKPEVLKVRFMKEPLAVYTGTVTVRLRLKALPGAAAKRLRLRVSYQACSDRLCSRPVHTVLAAALK